MSEPKNPIIDLNKVQSIEQLHLMLQQELNFPKFYGKNWDAFWDAITGLVEMPNVLTLKGWNSFEVKFPRDSRILKETIEAYNEVNTECQIQIE